MLSLLPLPLPPGPKQASVLAEGVPATATRLLKSDDSETAAAAAVLVATLCRLGGAAASSVDVDSTAILSLVRMLQDGSSLEVRAAAGCAIEELMKGDDSESPGSSSSSSSS